VLRNVYLQHLNGAQPYFRHSIVPVVTGGFSSGAGLGFKLFLLLGMVVPVVPATQEAEGGGLIEPRSSRSIWPT
jgi:hypothetical protein